MTTAAHLRKAALSQSEVEQMEVEPPEDGPGGVRRAWTVRGRQFAALDHDGTAHLRLDPESAARMAGELDAVEITDDGVLVDLAAISGMAITFWVREAWRCRAPSSLGAAAAEAARAAEGQEDDFGAIGAPARRALHGGGIADLDALASRPREEVAALHGVGPKAVRLLAAALAERGVDW